MAEKPIVAVRKTKPETVVDDIRILMHDAEFTSHLDPSAPVILKDNISWHFPFLGANTTPWQLEGVILALKDAGYDKIVCVQNETVVTNAFKGEQLNKYVPIFRKSGIQVLYNFRESDVRWIKYTPKAEMRVLNEIFPEGIRIPDYFVGKNIVHLPTVKCHIYTGTTGSMKNAFGGLLNSRRHYTHSVIHETLCDLLAIQKEIHTGIFTVMDGTVCGNGPGPRTMIPVDKDFMLASADSHCHRRGGSQNDGLRSFKPALCEHGSRIWARGRAFGRHSRERRRYLRGELAVYRGKQYCIPCRQIHLVRSFETDPKPLLSHSPGISFRVRVFFLPRLRVLAFEGTPPNASFQENQQVGKTFRHVPD